MSAHCSIFRGQNLDLVDPCNIDAVKGFIRNTFASFLVDDVCQLIILFYSPRSSFQNIQFHADLMTKTIWANAHLRAMSEVLCKQCPLRMFAQNLDLVKFFAICRRQDVAQLPYILVDLFQKQIFSETAESLFPNANLWSVAPFRTFLERSAFKKWKEEEKMVVCKTMRALSSMSRRVKSKEIQYFIQDSIYDHFLYCFIFSEVVRNTIPELAPFQIDVWIVADKVLCSDNPYYFCESDYSSDSEESPPVWPSEQERRRYELVLSLKKQMREGTPTMVKQYQFSPDMSEVKQFILLISQTVKNIVDHRNDNRRIVCIVDRRRQCFDFKTRTFGTNRDPVTAHRKDVVSILRPPEQFRGMVQQFSAFQALRLFQSHMMPRHALDSPRRFMREDEGQFFGFSFYCHSKNSIRLQWFNEKYSVRLTSLDMLLKLWPRCFEECQQTQEDLFRIKADIVQKWKLPLIDWQFKAYQADFLNNSSPRN